MVIYIVISLVSILLGGAVGFFIRIFIAKSELNSAETRANLILREAKLEAESQKKELLLEAKTFLIQERNNFEKQTKDRRIELQKLERRLIQKEELQEKRLDEIEKNERGIAEREKDLTEKLNTASKLQAQWHEELEKISGLSKEQAKQLLIKDLEEQAKQDAQLLINKIEEEAKISANKKSREIIVTTIQ